MSLTDGSKSFDSTALGLATAMHEVIKSVFVTANLDTTDNTDNITIYFDSNKKDGFSITREGNIRITYIVQNIQYQYAYTGQTIGSFSMLYYNISANKDIIAFGLTPGVLDFGFGYEKKIGYWEFFIGSINPKSLVKQSAYLFITDKALFKSQSDSKQSYNRWRTSSTDFNISLVQLPLFVIPGNFNSLFEVVSNYYDYQFNLYSVIYSNNKFYRLLQSKDIDYSIEGSKNSIILAMEVADD